MPKELKKWFLLAGYNRSDVMYTFNYIKRQGIAEKLLKHKDTKAAAPLTLSDEEIKFLKTVTKHPGMPISAVYKEAGLSPRKGNEIKKNLEDEGIILLQEQRTERGWTKYAEIQFTDELTKLLSS
jgi:hypothetical protein